MPEPEHYDSADDGPEVGVIRRETQYLAEEKDEPRSLDVNARFVLPTIVESLWRLAKKQQNIVLGSRIETCALLLEHVESDKMWDAIVPTGHETNQ